MPRVRRAMRRLNLPERNVSVNFNCSVADTAWIFSAGLFCL